MKRYLIGGTALCVLLLVGAALSWPDRQMRSRDVGCDHTPAGRERALCEALANSMQWTWMGHAIVSPGWRITWRGLRDVYCQQHVRANDVPLLEDLARTAEAPRGDWRLESGARDLILLTKVADGSEHEPINSIFNSGNPSYILKGGCLPAS